MARRCKKIPSNNQPPEIKPLCTRHPDAVVRSNEIHGLCSDMAITGIVLLISLQAGNDAVLDRVFPVAEVVNLPRGFDAG